MLRRIALFPPLCLALALGAGCSSEKDEVPAAPAGTLVSVAVARTQDVPVLLTSIGRLESRAAPLVAAEMDGRVLRLAVDEGAGIAAGAVLAEIDCDLGHAGNACREGRARAHRRAARERGATRRTLSHAGRQGADLARAAR